MPNPPDTVEEARANILDALHHPLCCLSCTRKISDERLADRQRETRENLTDAGTYLADTVGKVVESINQPVTCSGSCLLDIRESTRPDSGKCNDNRNARRRSRVEADERHASDRKHGAHGHKRGTIGEDCTHTAELKCKRHGDDRTPCRNKPRTGGGHRCGHFSVNRRKELPREYILAETDCPLSKPDDKALDTIRTRADHIRHRGHHHANACERTSKCRNRCSRCTPSKCQCGNGSCETRRRDNRAPRIRIDAVKRL